jgi:hypothetical protein
VNRCVSTWRLSGFLAPPARFNTETAQEHIRSS